MTQSLYVTGPKSQCCADTGACVTDTDGSVYCGGRYSCPYPAIGRRDPACSNFNCGQCNDRTEEGPARNVSELLFLDRRQKESQASMISGRCDDSFQHYPMCGVHQTWGKPVRDFISAHPCTNGRFYTANPPLPPTYPSYTKTGYKPPNSYVKEGFVSGRYRRKGGEPMYVGDIFCGCQTNVRPEIKRLESNTGGNYDLQQMVFNAQDLQVYPTALTPVLKGYRAFGRKEWRHPNQKGIGCGRVQTMRNQVYEGPGCCPDWAPTSDDIDYRAMCN